MKHVLIFVGLILYSFNYAQDDEHLKSIEGITSELLKIISVEIGEDPDWERYRDLYLPGATKISVRKNAPAGKQVRTFTVDEFIERVGPLYARDGFEEFATGLSVHEYNGIATAFQSFECRNLKGTYKATGINSFHLVYADDRWWIASTSFVNEDPDFKIPDEYKFSNLEIKKSSTSLQWGELETEAYRGKQDDIDFIDENNGWYINGYGKIFKTQDGGESWSKVFEQKGTFFRTIAFINDKVGFVGNVGTDYFPNVSDSIPLYVTRDGGESWKPVEYTGPYVKGLCALDLVKEPFINHGKTDYKYHLFGVGRVGSPANFMVSHDGGNTWASKSMHEDCKMLFDIKMLNKDVGFVCASSSESTQDGNAMILKTVDGGKSWKKVYQSDRPFETTWKISFPTDQVGYATVQSYNPDEAITQQRIVKSLDGGETWKELNLVNDKKNRPFGIG
ncbi:MAG: hypothetical protein AAGK97_12655, partial [Bacteroidota bacterium]